MNPTERRRNNNKDDVTKIITSALVHCWIIRVFRLYLHVYYILEYYRNLVDYTLPTLLLDVACRFGFLAPIQQSPFAALMFAK